MPYNTVSTEKNEVNMVHSLNIKNTGIEDEYFRQVKRVFLRKANDLYGICEGNDYNVELKSVDDMEGDSYRIVDLPGGVRVEASSRLGIISGAGRILQENDFDGDGMEITHFSGVYVPKQEFCGVYFASHFGNYYINAPEDEVIGYVEELALWGVGFIRVWFDFHHYTGLDDPAALPIMKRLKLILKTGKYFGMKISFVSLANEGYKTTPDEMKAEWTAQNGYLREPCGHYHTEICPHKPGGLELIIKNRLDLFDAFSDTPPDILTFGVYDQGGCTCADCAPWAANGYIYTIKALIPAVKERFPDCRIGFCVWYLDLFIEGEWDKVYEAFETDTFLQNEIEYIAAVHTIALPKNPVYAEAIRKGFGPGHKPLLGFPEISMQSCTPWGGFGANPYPAYLQRDWDNVGHVQAGMWCYSEGIFEDINKYIVLGLYQGRYKTAQDAMLGYVRAEISKKYSDDIMKLLNILDATLPRTCENSDRNDPDLIRMVIKHPEQVQTAAELAQKINGVLPERIRNGWRWRIIYLRAMADKALMDSDYYIREECEKYLRELEMLYHVGDNTYWCVSPATREAFRKNTGEKNV